MRPAILDGGRLRLKGRGSLLLRALLGLLCLAYLATSAVIVVNAFVWLPSLPSAWYRLQDILYWPFQPYFGLMLRSLGARSVPYSVYTVATWGPFVMLAAAALVLLLRRHLRPIRATAKNTVQRLFADKEART